jgi:hypothetical protein
LSGLQTSAGGHQGFHASLFFLGPQLAYLRQLACAGCGYRRSIFDIPLCRFPYFSRELKHLAPLGRRHPLDWLVKSRRNIELDDPCHSILRCVFFRQLEESNSDAKVCVDCKWLKINQVAPGPERCSRCRPEAQPRSTGRQTRRHDPPPIGNQAGQCRTAGFAPDHGQKS